MKKRIFSISAAAILAIGFIVGSYLWKGLSQRPGFSQVKVTKGDIKEVISVSGKVTPVESSDLGFENGGKVIKLTHQIGDQVKAGELLAESNNNDILAQLAGANAQKNSAEAVLNEDKQLVDKEEYKLKSLKKSDTANSADMKAQKEQIDAQKSLALSQEAQVAAANDTIRFFNSQLEMTKIYAPFSGVISKQDAELGEVKQANAPFMTIISNDRFRVEAYVSELDVKNIQVGSKATITISEEEQKSLEASVSKVYPAENDADKVSSYKIILDFSGNISDLKSGMTADIHITDKEKSNVLLIPKEAVFEEGGKKFAYAIDGAARDKKEIETGIHGDNSMVEIVSGLNQGDAILILENK